MLAVRPLFYASYRDIYDALISSKMRVGTEFLQDFLRARGIILSPYCSRKELVEVIASYAYESADLDEICDQLEVHSRADRVTYTSLSNKVTPEALRNALAVVKSARQDRSSEVVEFKRSDDGRVEIAVDYYEIDEGRTLLRQHRPKQGKIEFMSTGSTMRVRFPGAERVAEIAQQLIEEVKRSAPGVVAHSIDLSAFNRLQRTRFFQLLIVKLEGYKVVDVKKVNVDRELTGPVFSTDETAEEIEEEDQEDVQTPGEPSSKEVSDEVKYYLKKCTLAGSGILHAKELRRFLESDFFISRIVWEAQPRKKTGNPKAELEALLELPAEGLGFKYTVRGVYSQKRTKKYATTKRRPKDVERERLLDLLELAAQSAFAEVSKELESGEPK